MDILQTYSSFKELTSFKINNYLDEELGLYDKCIEPLNKELLQDSSDSEGVDRINVLFRLILWDKLFYEKYEFDEKKLLGSYRKKTFIDALLPIINNSEKYKDSYEALIEVLGRWPQIRDLIFRQQKAELDKCTSINDFISFVEKNPYHEYYLNAKYRISQLNNTPFDEAKIAIEKFRQSDMLPIKQLEALFQEVNGIHFMWDGIASESDNNAGIKELIINLISNCKPTSISDECLLLQDQPIDYYLLRRILPYKTETADGKLLNYELYLHDCHKKEINDKLGVVSSKEFFFLLISMLNNMVSGINFSLPNVGMIPLGDSTVEYLWANSLDNPGSQVVFRSRDGRVFPDSKGFYAGCRLMLHTKTN